LKLREAELQREHLKSILSRLEERVTRDSAVGAPLNTVLTELLSVAQKIRDLDVSISWTKNIIKLTDQNLSSFIVKRDSAIELAILFESLGHAELYARAEELRESAYNLNLTIDKISWEIDLQVPNFLAPTVGPEPKEGT